jgi:hypothetical protein
MECNRVWFTSTVLISVASVDVKKINGLDPADAAREVFENQAFWWKRAEPARKVSTSWFESALAAVLDFFGGILAAIGDWLAKMLSSLWRALLGGPSGGTIWVWLIVVVLLAWLLWKLYPVIVSWLSGERLPATTREVTSWETLPEASQLFEQAGQAFRDGMNAEAIRLALLALIARLESRGLLRYDHTRTNREYQRELREQADVAAPFGEVARIYERVWYGRWPAGQAEAERAISVSGLVIHGKEAAPEHS